MKAIERVAGRLPGGKLGHGVAALVAGTGISQLLVVACAPLLTRLYSPAAYGAFAAAVSIMAILIAITCLRYEFAIPLPESDVAAANVLALALLVNLVFSTVSAIVLTIFGSSLLGLVGASAIGPYALLLAVGQLGGGTSSALVNWAVRTRTFGEIASARLSQAVGLLIVQLGLGLAGFGAPGLLVGDVVGRIAGSGRLARSAWRTHAGAMRKVSRRGIADAAGRYRRFPLFSAPSALLSVLGMQVPLLAVVALYGTAMGGEYALADRVCSIPLTLVAGAVGQVYLGEAARLARRRVGALRGPFARTTRRLATVAILPTALVMFLAPILAGPILGRGWSEVGIFIAILAPMYFVSFVTTATGDTLYVLERQDLQLVREVLRLVLLGGSIPLASAFGLGSTQAIVFLSLVGTAYYALYGLISWFAIIQQRALREPDGMTAADSGAAGSDLAAK